MANKFYITLPSPQPNMSKGACRRSPLTPSTVSPPCLSAHTSARQDTGGVTPRATALLARVASHPGTPRRGTPCSSPLPSPSPRSPFDSFPHMESGPRDHPAHNFRRTQSDGYISFPDFEKFCQAQIEDPRQEQPKMPTAKT